MKLLLIYYPMNHLFSLHGSFLGNWLFSFHFSAVRLMLVHTVWEPFLSLLLPHIILDACVCTFFKNKESRDFLFYLCICLLWAALGFRCFGRASLVWWVGAVLRCGVKASCWSGFSCGAQLQAHSLQWLSWPGSRAWAQELPGRWNLPRPGTETMPPALAVGFLSPAPPGKFRVCVCVCVCVYFLKNEIQNKVCSVYKTLRCPPFIPWDWPCSCKLTLTPSGARALLSSIKQLQHKALHIRTWTVKDGPPDN